MEPVLYEYRQQGRTLFSLVFLVCAIVIVGIGAAFDTPLYWYMPVGFGLLFAAWHFMSNPDHGYELTKDKLQIWSGKDQQSFPKSDIAFVQQRKMVDGQGGFTIVLKDNSEHAITPPQIGSNDEFARAVQSADLVLKPAD